MNYQSLTHPTVRKNILAACRNAQKYGTAYVENRFKAVYLVVRYRKGSFRITDKNNICCVMPVWFSFFRTEHLSQQAFNFIQKYLAVSSKTPLQYSRSGITYPTLTEVTS